MRSDDTIVAISSAVGESARMTVRLSGPDSARIAAELGAKFANDSGRGATARRVVLRFNDLELPAWMYRFTGPHSYTGQDIVELHIPGNPLLARMLLEEISRRGARHAEAGEFTARAYFNGRMDLTEAEGVAATIAAHGERELAAARQLLSGELARRLVPLVDELAEVLALVETGIDFSEEDITLIAARELARRIVQVDDKLVRLSADSARFERLSHQPQLVLVGRANAGKSTLLNALAGVQRAVVSPVAGTTRDVIWAEVPLRKGLVRLVDAAGLGEEAPSESDSSPQADIARQMRQHALSAVESADFVLLVHDASDRRPMLIPPRPPHRVIFTKLDLAEPPLAVTGQMKERWITVSAKAGRNLDQLRSELSELAFGPSSTRGSSLALNARHLESLAEAMNALKRAAFAAGGSGAEIVALELREAIDALGRIVGRVTPDDVLERIFSRFCIGK